MFGSQFSPLLTQSLHPEPQYQHRRRAVNPQMGVFITPKRALQSYGRRNKYALGRMRDSMELLDRV
jgi:hypothetical protein